MVEKKRRTILVSDKPRSNGLLRVGLDVSRILRAVLPKDELIILDLKNLWDEIVGATLMEMTYPVKISGTTLHIKASNGAAAIELQAMADDVIARIDGVMAAGVVTRIKVVG